MPPPTELLLAVTADRDAINQQSIDFVLSHARPILRAFVEEIVALKRHPTNGKYVQRIPFWPMTRSLFPHRLWVASDRAHVRAYRRVGQLWHALPDAKRMHAWEAELTSCMGPEKNSYAVETHADGSAITVVVAFPVPERRKPLDAVWTIVNRPRDTEFVPGPGVVWHVRTDSIR